ncbi:hypothetical protein L579_3734 [Pantoea sp. AS-PWVM4]|nr:DUF2235 domain-containing protein [Pantoea sp. AS-PWVM4]ERK17333.1 hypothetical protein L579_3734 [Pantoea sp. AS-PWVM4]
MSEITGKAQVWYPPAFPAQGRLPAAATLVGENCKKQNSRERAYRQELCLAAGRRVEPPCCKTLHISLFFDGTGNNLNNDLYLSDPPHPTNIARLFSATIGSGYAGGVGAQQAQLFDIGAENYFKFYIPGVGTPFPEIDDLDYSTWGLAFASNGEDRINWALLRIIDVLKRTLKDPGQDGLKLSESESRAALENMKTSWAHFGFGGSHNRYEEFTRQLRALKARLKNALEQPEPGKPKLLGIKLYIYGFSRGAAAARAFVSWLSELLPPPAAGEDRPEQCLAVEGMKIPLSVEFLGLLDTVASVGVAHMVPLADGHMSWADGTLELPDETTYGGLIKRCVHLVSSHEQRLCFPLDSIRRGNGEYPANSVEVIYPGMHSDVGGGYPRGDQGKANDKLDRLLLSQITLHDMYAAAFTTGAPLKVPEFSIPDALKQQNWRILDSELQIEFAVAPDLIHRFNAWRERTLNLPTPDTPDDLQAADYQPTQAPVCLEVAADAQMAWITGWRINRYALKTLLQTPFYQRATDTQAGPEVRRQARIQRDKDQAAVEARRRKSVRLKDYLPEPGIKDFDPDMAQTQLREAAQEFAEDYHKVFRSLNSAMEVLVDKTQQVVFLLNSDDEETEYFRMKAAGEQKHRELLESADGLLMALFDDQVHDSRAWFLHASLGSREPWGSYFRYRMIYFGDKCSKSLAALVVDGKVPGMVTQDEPVLLRFRVKSDRDIPPALAVYDVEVVDRQSGAPVPLLAESASLRQFTREPGVVVAQQRAINSEQHLAQVKSALQEGWREKAQSAIA